MNGTIKNGFRVLWIASVAILLACGGGSERPSVSVVASDSVAPHLMIQGVDVFDAETGRIDRDRNVWIRDGRISRIEVAEVDVPKTGVRVLDGAGATLVPGLIDMHGHVHSSSAPAWAIELPDAEANLRAYLYSGVTTVFDPGDGSDDAFTRRLRVLNGELAGPRIFTAGPIHTTPDGHPISLVRAIAPAWIGWLIAPGTAHVISSSDDAEAAAMALAEAGADAMKIVVDAIPLDAPVMPREIVEAIVKSATSHGLPVVAHIGTAADAIVTGEAGVSLWVHTVYQERLSDEAVARIAAFGIPMVATIEVMDQYARSREGPRELTRLERETVPASLIDLFWPIPSDFDSGTLTSWIDQQREMHRSRILHDNVRRLRAAGVTILAGSDTQSGVFPGAALHRELAHLVEVGFTPAEAIRAATLDSARYLTGDARPDFGFIETGRIADLLVVEGDPTSDVGALQDIRYLFQGGTLIERTPIPESSAVR